MSRSSSIEQFTVLNPWAGSPSFTNFNLDNNTKTDGTYSDDQYAIGFTPLDNETLSEVHVFLAAVAGSPTATNITCDIFASDTTTNLSPTGTSLGQQTIGSVASVGWQSFTGFSIALTAGSRYWAVIRSKETTPATDRIQIVNPDGGGGQLGSTFSYRLAAGQSTNGGSTWSMNVRYGYYFKFASGNVLGIPIGVNTTDQQLYGTMRAGTKFTVPGSVGIPIVGFIGYINAETGNPTGDLIGELYNDTTLVATSIGIPDAIASNSFGFYTFIFDDAYTVSAGSSIRLVMGVSTGGDSSNRHNVRYHTTPETTDSRACLWGNPIGTYYNGSSWSDGSIGLTMLQVLADMGQTTASSGGLLTHPGMAGGLRG